MKICSAHPPPVLQELVLGALQVDNRESYETWRTKAKAATDATREQLPQWQQFIVHAVDERGDPISDYQIELYSMEDDTRLDLQLDPISTNTAGATGRITWTSGIWSA